MVYWSNHVYLSITWHFLSHCFFRALEPSAQSQHWGEEGNVAGGSKGYWESPINILYSRLIRRNLERKAGSRTKPPGKQLSLAPDLVHSVPYLLDKVTLQG